MINPNRMNPMTMNTNGTTGAKNASIPTTHPNRPGNWDTANVISRRLDDTSEAVINMANNQSMSLESFMVNRFLDLIFDRISKVEMLLIAAVSLAIAIAAYVAQGSPAYQNAFGAFLAFVIAALVIGIIWGLVKLFSGGGID